jgi:hypothetical protein
MMRTDLLDYERIRFLRLLFTGYLDFRDQYQHFENEGTIPRARSIEHLCQGVFQDLRTCAHKVFGPAREGADSPWRDQELLCDLVLGACYHEILQLQENLYLVKLYRPRYEEIQSHSTDQSLNEYFHVGRSLIDEAEVQIPKNMTWIWQLIQEAMRLMKGLLSSQRGNRILLRFLTQNIPLLEKVYEKGEIEEIFGGMFPGGLREALWESSRDLIHGYHLPGALDSLSRLVAIEKTSSDTVISLERIREALHGVLGTARMNRNNELVNRCEMLIAQVS